MGAMEIWTSVLEIMEGNNWDEIMEYNNYRARNYLEVIEVLSHQTEFL